MPDLTKVPWRVGTKQGRTVYAIVDERPEIVPDDCDDPAKLSDVMIGVMDTRELAQEVVNAHNARALSRAWHPSSHE